MKVNQREFISVNCLGNRTLDVQISKSTTCGDVIKELRALLNLAGGGNEYSQLARSPTFFPPTSNPPLEGPLYHLPAIDAALFARSA